MVNLQSISYSVCQTFIKVKEWPGSLQNAMVSVQESHFLFSSYISLYRGLSQNSLICPVYYKWL